MTDPRFQEGCGLLEMLWLTRNRDTRFDIAMEILRGLASPEERDSEHARMVEWFKQLRGGFDQARLNVIDITERIRRRRERK